MRKNILGFLLLITASSAFAQKNPKAAFTSAMMSLELYLADNKEVAELESAKKNIDYATEQEQTKTNPKVWRYRGKIYASIAFDAKLKISEKTAAKIAFEAWKEAWKLDLAKLKEKGKAVSKVPAKTDYKEGFELVARGLYNTGIEAYNGKDYQLAFDCFNGILNIKPLTKEGLGKRAVNLKIGKSDMELEAARLGGSAATSLGNCEQAEAIFTPLLEGKKILEEQVPSTYASLANCYIKAQKIKKAKEILTKARKEFPTNQGLLIAEIDLALSQGNLTELEDKLKQAVEGDKENVELHFVLGNVYDELFRKKIEASGNSKEALSFFDKAIVWYKKARAINPAHFNTAYSLGVIYVNHANLIADEMNSITDLKSKKLTALGEKYDEVLAEALKYLLVAEEINEHDLGTAIALRQVYARNGQQDKATTYSEKVKNMRAKASTGGK